MAHEFHTPSVREIPLIREQLDHDTFGDFNSSPEPDEDYSIPIAEFAKRLAKEALNNVVDLNEYRKT